MTTWLVSLVLSVLVGTQVLANSPVTFIENLQESRSGPSRIVSGWEATLGQFPHQISLRMVNSIGGVNACGGSIIHPEWGITAAHCPGGRVSIVIRAGLVNLTQPQYIFETTKYYNHPLYDDFSPFVQPNDIGLIDFGRRLVFGEFVKPIRLQSWADRDRDYDAERLVASGWGRTWTDGPAPENLNWVYMLGNTNERCRMQYGAIVENSTICASFYNVTSQSTCQGDSGGPLSVIDDDGEYSMVGIASFVSGLGCHVGFPAGFIRPGHYHPWFTEVSGLNFDWGHVTTTTGSPPNNGTEEPQTTTSARPENTTSVPETTTSARPENTTSVPETTTSARPENTTSVPETTTSARPENTTSVPETTTSARPENTTSAPVTTTSARPENTTSVPESTTSIIIDTTSLRPENNTSVAPEITTSVRPENTTTESFETTTGSWNGTHLGARRLPERFHY